MIREVALHLFVGLAALACAVLACGVIYGGWHLLVFLSEREHDARRQREPDDETHDEQDPPTPPGPV